MPSARASARGVVWLITAQLCLALAGCGDDAGGDSVSDAAAHVDAGRTPDAAVRDAGREHTGMDAAMLDAAALLDATPTGSDAGDDASVDANVDAGPAPSSQEPRGRLSLVDQSAWTPVAAADDPFDDRPANPNCDASGYRAEEFSTEIAYSIDTARCAYLTATQATIDEVRPGEEVFLRVWHFALSGPDGAEAHVVLTLDGITLIDEHIPIPADGGLLTARWTASETIVAGAPVFLHVHNHGANQYAFLELSTGAPE